MSLEEAAARLLGLDGTVTGRAPGRCTVVGEHIDYAGGAVLAVAVDRAVVAAAAPSERWRLVSAERSVDLGGGIPLMPPLPGGDGRSAADRVAAVAVALRERGIDAGPAAVALAADLPIGAGLSASAALSCAVAVALLRRAGARLSADDLAAVALHAERDLVGIPCGPLDPRAVIAAPAGGAILVDCRAGGGDTPVPWALEGVALVVADTGERHDVGGAGYRARRAEADDALERLGAGTWREVAAAGPDGGRGLPAPLDRRARHIVSEMARVEAAVAALRGGDAARLGALVTASGRSLRDDYEVSTARLEACVEAALGIAGCLGARMVGGGFGGSVVAVVERGAARACAAAMRAAGAREAWPLSLGVGVAAGARGTVS